MHTAYRDTLKGCLIDPSSTNCNAVVSAISFLKEVITMQASEEQQQDVQLWFNDKVVCYTLKKLDTTKESLHLLSDKVAAYTFRVIKLFSKGINSSPYPSQNSQITYFFLL